MTEPADGELERMIADLIQIAKIADERTPWAQGRGLRLVTEIVAAVRARLAKDEDRTSDLAAANRLLRMELGYEADAELVAASQNSVPLLTAVVAKDRDFDPPPALHPKEGG